MRCRFLHNHTMTAVAQKKYVYIYDNQGIELHCLRNHVEVNRLDFLPYHFLLVSIGKLGYLNYQDVSTGDIVCSYKTKRGDTNVLTHNPRNAVVHVGHKQGVVTLWTPNLASPAVEMFCHSGPVRAMAVSPDGHTMATSGSEGRVRLWDLRTYRCVTEFPTLAPAKSIDFSQRGLMALGIDNRVEIFKGDDYYMRHELSAGMINQVKFCPYADVCAIGHSGGFSSIVSPGAGEANFDAFEANPFETLAMRRETEVKQLLDKLQPDMITLDHAAVGSVRPKPTAAAPTAPDSADEGEEDVAATGSIKLKHKARGRSKSSKQWAARKLAQQQAKGTQDRPQVANKSADPDIQHFAHVLDRFK